MNVSAPDQSAGGNDDRREASTARRAAAEAPRRLVLAPGGTHLMLMGPAKALPEGSRARIRLVLADGRRVFAEFEVRREAPPVR